MTMYMFCVTDDYVYVPFVVVFSLFMTYMTDFSMSNTTGAIGGT